MPIIIPDALISAASLVNRMWGSYGYGIEAVSSAGDGSCLLAVVAGDGSRFHVGSTRHGNTVHADTQADCERALAQLIHEERRP